MWGVLENLLPTLHVCSFLNGIKACKSDEILCSNVWNERELGLEWFLAALPSLCVLCVSNEAEG